MYECTVFFDLDDTLVAFDAVTDSSWIQVCSDACPGEFPIPSMVMYRAIKEQSDWYWSDENRHKIGRQDIRAARRKIVSQAFAILGLLRKDAELLADRYSEVRIENMYLIPGAEETLLKLVNAGVPMGLITNGDSAGQRSKIERFGLDRFFKHILIEGEVGIGKPYVGIYRRALSLMDTDAANSWMVGDNLIWDIEAPQSIGMHGVWYDWRGKGLPPKPAAIPEAVIRTSSRTPQLCWHPRLTLS